MLLIIFLLTVEVLSIPVLIEHLRKRPKILFRIILSVHFLLSIWLWFLIFKTLFYKGPFDSPGNVNDLLNIMGIVSGVVIPRFIIITLHYLGRLIRIRKGGYILWLTRAGMITALLIAVVIILSTSIGRFNFKTEHVTIRLKNLPSGLNGLKIVHISDMHLASFYRHEDKMADVIDKVNALHPDIIINTGDFISFGWREFGRFDTLLKKGSGRFGNFAILGNHDAGTYLPKATGTIKDEIVTQTSRLVTSSGYQLLKDESFITEINGVKVAFIGVTTGGRHPDISHGDLQKAMEGTDSADFKILLAHDPNQWDEEVVNKTDVDLTLSGHTHGMQMGIMTKRLRWSPSKYFYPHWNGLYSHGNQVLYVNRGLGALAIPFRIWMPPEITLITLVTN